MYRLKEDNHILHFIFRIMNTSLLTIMKALVHFVYAMWYRFEGVFCSSLCHLQHIVSQGWYRELTPYFVKCILFTNINEFYRSFYISLINWPVKFKINTTIHGSRVTQKYTMYVSLAFIDTFQWTCWTQSLKRISVGTIWLPFQTTYSNIFPWMKIFGF